MSYTEEKARKKLVAVDSTQQAIQTTSQWCLFHYRHAQNIVALWHSLFINQDAETQQTPSEYKLAMFYLCNDIVQFAKKKDAKYVVFLTEFQKQMPSIMENVSNDMMSSHLVSKYSRVLDVWKDRSIFSPACIINLHKLLSPKKRNSSESEKQMKATASGTTCSFTSTSNDKPNTGPLVPAELMIVSSKYTELNSLYNAYKDDYMNFNKVTSTVLKSDVNKIQSTNDPASSNNDSVSTGSEQLSSLLSSLSSLHGNITVPSTNQQNTYDQTHDEQDNNLELQIQKLQDAEILGTKIDKQANEIYKLRVEIASELRKLANELDDWMQLDKGKQTKLESMVNKIKTKKEGLQFQLKNEVVYDYSSTNNDDVSAPHYSTNHDDDDSDDEVRYKNDSDDDSDDAMNEDARNGDAMNEDAMTEDDNNVNFQDNKNELPSSVTGNQPTVVSSLRKRLLGDDDSGQAKKPKSVKFAEDAETRVFDNTESVLESTTESQKISDAQDTASQSLDALLGMLK